jgi:hypothetical protein
MTHADQLVSAVERSQFPYLDSLIHLFAGGSEHCYTPTVHEQSLIAAFVAKTKRDRYREILSNPRLRRKLTN